MTAATIASTAAPAAGQARALDPLLTAPILPTLLRFALPNMAAMLSTALAAIAETTYVGSFGVASLAAMALVFPMIMLQQMMSAGASYLHPMQPMPGRSRASSNCAPRNMPRSFVARGRSTSTLSAFYCKLPKR